MEHDASGPAALPAASKRASRFALVAGVGLVLLGGAVLAGWVLEVPFLVQLHPDLAPMQGNAALGLALCGLGVLALRSGRAGAAAALGLVVAALAALTFAQ